MGNLADLMESVVDGLRALPDDTPPESDPVLDASRRASLAEMAVRHRIPEGFRWARIGTPEFDAVEAKTPRAGEFARTWQRKAGSAILLGPTGAGKTASAVALMQRLLDVAGTKPMPESKCRWAVDLRFIPAADLVVARRNSRLGEEADLVQVACTCSLLFLDELGFEVKSTVPFEVLDARYRTGKPTVITCGLREGELAKRYGSAFLRRIKDRGRVWDLWCN